MIERLALVAVLAAVVLAVCLAARASARRRASAVIDRRLPEELAGRFRGTGGGIVYFYGPHCASCREQRAILARLADERGVAVVDVDATLDARLADSLAVATVPTTVVVGADLRVRAVNLGFRSHQALTEQVDRVA